jgi:hypothetical protein
VNHWFTLKSSAYIYLKFLELDFWNLKFHTENNAKENVSIEYMDENLESQQNGLDNIRTSYDENSSDEFDDIFAYFFVSSLFFLLQKLLRDTIL